MSKEKKAKDQTFQFEPTVFTNEMKAKTPILPERFDSTSQPSPTGVVNFGPESSVPYCLNEVFESPVFYS